MSANPALNLEALLAAELSEVVEDSPLDSDLPIAPASSLCATLERLLPVWLNERHPEWRGESLDGVFLAIARKIGPRSARLAGTCILLSDQTVTPFDLTLELSNERSFIERFHLSIGQPGTGRLGISGPGAGSFKAEKLLWGMPERLGAVAWSFEVSREAT
ncbi:MAG: hypothetical protein RL885_24820 [Planctomycetota bacterium]